MKWASPLDPGYFQMVFFQFPIPGLERCDCWKAWIQSCMRANSPFRKLSGIEFISSYKLLLLNSLWGLYNSKSAPSINTSIGFSHFKVNSWPVWLFFHHFYHKRHISGIFPLRNFPAYKIIPFDFIVTFDEF